MRSGTGASLPHNITLLCNDGQVPRPTSPHVRTALIERAATLLAGREPVTLRGLVQGTGVSTMAVYTYFDGMPGLWRAVRQEGFTRLARRLEALAPSDDPVRDLAALGAAYVAHAVAEPTLYRAMFDAAADLEDPAAAGRGLELLVAAATRARDAGRFAEDCDPATVALRQWAGGHGLTMLVVTGVLPPEVLEAHGPGTAVALFVDAGDDPATCRASVAAGWTPVTRAG